MPTMTAAATHAAHASPAFNAGADLALARLRGAAGEAACRRAGRGMGLPQPGAWAGAAP